jgi:GT2 family glycosyltransferase/glycosyltransferase involved in cell wall biosynthesis
MARLARLLRALPLLLLSLPLTLLAAAAFLLADLLWVAFGRRRPPANRRPATAAASVIIPNWNGRDLLERYLPTVVEAAQDNAGNEVIVVDNGSTDGSAGLLRERFPTVKVVALECNQGFGGGSNAGVRAARNDVVVLLNNDMRVDHGFLGPLLEGFTDASVFAVSCQIFFSDPAKPREETGLTQGWWADGSLRVRHRDDPAVGDLYPCFYGGGGSCAFDRAKFLELGGFDPLLAPFYLEDTDLGYLAWKRGWKVLYQPRSMVWHEHRGTIGRRFTGRQIETILKKNFLLFCWKNIHEWPRLASHFAFALSGAWVSLVLGDSPERASLEGLWGAFRQLPGALGSRWRARGLAVLDDTEAFRRPLGGYFRDRFLAPASVPERLGVLFVSPYPVSPPVHGGGVFMNQTVRALGEIADVHLVAMLDYPWERPAHDELGACCRSMEFILRLEGQNHAFGSIVPSAVREFASPDLEWIIHRQICLHGVDVVQLEYTNMGQYAAPFRRLVCALFEHDIYFQSIARILPGLRGTFRKMTAAWEYLRALRYELQLLPAIDRVQVCSRENRDLLVSFLPKMAGRIQDGLRAGIDVRRYTPRYEGREPGTMLFLGSFRHPPNLEALAWFARRVLPRVLDRRPEARLIIVGSDPPPRHSLPDLPGVIDMVGYVEDVRDPLGRYALFLCPILSGSGIRVKLLEAFAAGIPAVSTRLGAEGLTETDGDLCALADTPESFADRIVALFERPAEAAAMARRARAEVEAHRDIRVMAGKLEASYREALAQKRGIGG